MGLLGDPSTPLHRPPLQEPSGWPRRLRFPLTDLFWLAAWCPRSERKKNRWSRENWNPSNPSASKTTWRRYRTLSSWPVHGTEAVTVCRCSFRLVPFKYIFALLPPSTLPCTPSSTAFRVASHESHLEPASGHSIYTSSREAIPGRTCSDETQRPRPCWRFNLPAPVLHSHHRVFFLHLALSHPWAGPRCQT